MEYRVTEWAAEGHKINTIRWGVIPYWQWLVRMGKRMAADTEIQTGAAGKIALFRIRPDLLEVV